MLGVGHAAGKAILWLFKWVYESSYTCLLGLYGIGLLFSKTRLPFVLSMRIHEKNTEEVFESID